MISLRGITKRFGEYVACEPIDLDIERGEFFSLLGPSGCGKTTMMRMVAGFITPSAGEVFIDGQPVVELPPNKRPVNMVFQNYAIFPHLNVEQNIGFGLRKRALGSKEKKRRIDGALDLIGLSGYGKRRAHELSGGERQRIALARALVCEPKALLLDEPLGALDKKLRERMQFELRELQRRVGITFLFVTHDQEEALSMSSRICVMNRGKVVEIATPSELYKRPKSKFTAEFVGTMNIFNCIVVPTDDGYGLTSRATGNGVIARRPSFGVANGRAVVAGIRPESICIEQTDLPASAPNSARVSVLDVSYLGDRWMVITRADEGRILVSVPGNSPMLPYPGQVLTLSWTDDAVLLLNEA